MNRTLKDGNRVGWREGEEKEKTESKTRRVRASLTDRSSGN